MKDNFFKFILSGILVALIVIALKLDNQPTVIPPPSVSVDNTQQFVQIAPNRVGIVDSGIHSGMRGNLIVFDFDPETKTFKYVETLNASYILNHPEEFGIPVRK